jgi:hypothetical protein
MGKGFIKIPAPYGLNVFNYAGGKVASLGLNFFGQSDNLIKETFKVNNQLDYNQFGKITESVMGAAFEIVDPLNGSSSPSNFIPTVIKPPAEAALNINYKGMPIHYETMGKMNDVDSFNSKLSTSDFYKYLAQTTNILTGGTQNTKGLIDVYPESIKHVVESYGGGLFKLANQTTDLLVSDKTKEQMIKSFPKSKEYFDIKERTNYFHDNFQKERPIPIISKFLPAKSDIKPHSTLELLDMYKYAGNHKLNGKEFRKLDKLIDDSMQEYMLDEKAIIAKQKEIIRKQVEIGIGDDERVPFQVFNKSYHERVFKYGLKIREREMAKQKAEMEK